VRLLLASSTSIQRHVKIKSAANPYDMAHETYFEKREEDHMAETFRGTRTLRFLWKFQRGSCPVCNARITRITGWRIHYCVPRVMGGSTNTDDRVLLHRERFIANIFPYRNRVSLKEAFEGPEPDDGKLSRPGLRGLAPSNGGRLLGKPTSNNAKAPICRQRFGVLVPFVFSGMNKAGSALCAIQKSLGSPAGAFPTASPV